MIKFLFLILFFLFFIPYVNADINNNYTIEDNKVYINDDKVYLSMSPHTLLSSGYGYINLTSKIYSGDIDITLGYNSDTMKPKYIEYYKPHEIYLPDSKHEHIFYYVTNIRNTNLLPEYGNEYNTYKKLIDHKILIGYDNLTNQSIYKDVFNTVISFDSYLINNNNYTIYWNTNQSYIKNWVRLPNNFLNPTLWNYDGLNKWYIAKNLNVISNQSYHIRIWFNLPISLNKSYGKYAIATKPSHQTLNEALNTDNLYYLDPWYNTSFSNRIPITISTNGSNIPINYQVLLNITYRSQMQSDFDDIRFVNIDNDELPYWIELKNDENYCNVWVNLSNEIIHPNDSIIWMYYGNNEINNNSNVDDTFIFGDDFSGTSIDTSKWIRGYISGSSVVSGGELILTGGGAAWEEQHTANPVSTLGTITRMKVKAAAESNYIQIGMATNGLGDQTNFIIPYYFNINKKHSTKDTVANNIARTEVLTSDFRFSETHRNNGTDLKIFSGGLGDNLSQVVIWSHVNYISDEPLDIYFARYGASLITIDFIVVRKYIKNEPIISYGEAEYYILEKNIIIFKNDLNINSNNKISVYENEKFIGIYNYNQQIFYNDSLNYTFLINNDAIDIINNETFLITLFKNYGYVIISIFGMIILISVGIYFSKKVKR